MARCESCSGETDADDEVKDHWSGEALCTRCRAYRNISILLIGMIVMFIVASTRTCSLIAGGT